jgi:hypothetical protein
MAQKIFLLSPARTTGKKGQQLLNPLATFPLAQRLRTDEGVPLGELFSFVSGLYFRGKLTYANHFGNKEDVWIISSNQGLLPATQPITRSEFEAFAEEEIEARNESYRRPLEIDLLGLSHRPNVQFIFLGSLASPKYASILGPILQGKIYSPTAFPRLGDMARGALLLKQVQLDQELPYAAWTTPKPTS